MKKAIDIWADSKEVCGELVQIFDDNLKIGEKVIEEYGGGGRLSIGICVGKLPGVMKGPYVMVDNDYLNSWQTEDYSFHTTRNIYKLTPNLEKLLTPREMTPKEEKEYNECMARLWD